jgi:hypothetical protein
MFSAKGAPTTSDYDDIAPLALSRNESERRVNNLVIPSAGAIKLRILFMDER